MEPARLDGVARLHTQVCSPKFDSHQTKPSISRDMLGAYLLTVDQYVLKVKRYMSERLTA